jgi:glycerol-3-phosphate dehydrogenase
MRARDLASLEAGPYDLLVVGGGVHGLASAYDAASRGLRVALIEADDFGSGASFNHQKTAHGGLRSLGSLDLGRARESIRERRALARIAPWFLRPLPFLVGTYRSVTKNRLALGAAFKVDAWLGRHRNHGIEPELHLPTPRLVSKAATLRLFPGIHQEGLTGGAQWYDYQMVEADRITLAFAAAADRAGADLANHVEAIGAVKDGNRIAGMTARDTLTGTTLTVRAGAILNAAGARAGEVMRLFGAEHPFPLLKAMNLVTSKRASDMALAAPAPDGRMLTLTPWRGRALVGTSQSGEFVQPGDTQVTAAEVDAFIEDANHAFPALRLTRTDVTLVHRGVVPAAAGRDGKPDLKPSPEILDHAADGAAGAITLIGVKYTTARAVAERAVNAVAKRLGRRLPPSRTAAMTLPGAGIADHEALAIETARALRANVPLPLVRHLIRLYAEAAPAVIKLMQQRDDLRTPLDPAAETIGAEVLHVIRNEAALKLSDIIVRRTGLGGAGAPPRGAVENAARIAAEELGWNERQTAAEIAAVESVYVIDGASDL